MLAVAAVSARALAEAAAADSIPVLALDLFGDLDTRRAAAAWRNIGTGQGLAIDGERLLSALAQIANDAAALGQREGSSAAGWVAGAGLEGRPDLLERGQALLPLLGTTAADVRALRQARVFFAVLDEQGVRHPEVRFDPPPQTDGWLLKDSAGSGGWQVRRAASTDLDATLEDRPAGLYWQAERRGLPMSVTLLCNGRQARMLGFNRQLVQPVGELPFVFAGILGPVPVEAAVRADVEAAAQCLTRRFGVRGLASLDFLLVDGRPEVLELNPRPPASLSLYPHIGGGGPLSAHLRACLNGDLPAAADDGLVRGLRIVYAPRSMVLTAAQAGMLAARADLHDLPAAAARFEAGEPVCTIGMQGRHAEQLAAELQQAHDLLLADLLADPLADQGADGASHELQETLP